MALEQQQPNCKLTPINYGEQHSNFLPKVQKTVTMARDCRRLCEGLLYKKEKIDRLYQTLQKLTTTRSIYQSSFAESSLNFTKRVLLLLTSLKQDAEKNHNCLDEIQKAEMDLKVAEAKLDKLIEQTHEWQIIADENKRRCTKCLAEEYLEEKKSQPTIYDEESKDYSSYW